MAPVKIQIKFAKFLIGVNKAAVNAAVLAELGMYPVSIQALIASGCTCYILEKIVWFLQPIKRAYYYQMDLAKKLNYFYLH